MIGAGLTPHIYTTTSRLDVQSLRDGFLPVPVSSSILSATFLLPPRLKAKHSGTCATAIQLHTSGRNLSFSFRAGKDYVEGNVSFPSGLEKIINCVLRWVLPLSFFCSFSTLEAVTFLLRMLITCANKSTRESCSLRESPRAGEKKKGRNRSVRPRARLQVRMHPPHHP